MGQASDTRTLRDYFRVLRQRKWLIITTTTVAADQTTRDQAQRARAALDHLPEKPTGIVVTGVKRGSEDDYYGYYYAPAKPEKSGAGAGATAG